MSGQRFKTVGFVCELVSETSDDAVRPNSLSGFMVFPREDDPSRAHRANTSRRLPLRWRPECLRVHDGWICQRSIDLVHTSDRAIRAPAMSNATTIVDSNPITATVKLGGVVAPDCMRGNRSTHT